MDERLASAGIRPAVTDDIEEVAALWCEAFPSRRTVTDRVRLLEVGGRYGGLETVLVARDDAGRLLAACKIYRMTQRLCGVRVPMMGLAAVAVTPAARRHGLGARLCTRAMHAARDRGDVVSVLYPFRPDYYERLGWGLVGEMHAYRFRTAALPRSGEARHVRHARDPADFDGVAACYARIVEGAHGPIERDDRIWAWRLTGEEVGVRPPEAEAWEATRRGLVVYDRGGVAGYALLRAREGSVRVREVLAETEAAYRGLLGYLADRAERWPVARHTARVEERLGDRLGDPRPPDGGRARSLWFPTARIIRGPMLRVLDVPRALTLRPYFHAAPGAGQGVEATVEIEVDDAQIAANRGPWHLRLSGGAGTVRPADGAAADARLRADAAVFGRIFAGDVAPREAARLGRASTAGDLDLLDHMFATGERWWILDEF